jgi:hypothetical protein
MKRSEIYKPLRDRAKDQLPYLRFIDLQKGQMQDTKQNYPIPLPALLIELGDFQFSNLLEHQQKGDGKISLYLYLDLVSDSFAGAEREDETIAILDHFDELFEAFEGFAIQNLTPLVREVEHKPQYGTRCMMLRIDFTTTIDDGKGENNIEFKKFRF